MRSESGEFIRKEAGPRRWKLAGFYSMIPYQNHSNTMLSIKQKTSNTKGRKHRKLAGSSLLRGFVKKCSQLQRQHAKRRVKA